MAAIMNTVKEIVSLFLVFELVNRYVAISRDCFRFDLSIARTSTVATPWTVRVVD